MKASKIIDLMIDCIAETADIEKEALVPEASFEDDLGFDSLNQAEVTIALEDRFDITISDEDALDINTVNDLIKYLITHIPCEIDVPLSFSGTPDADEDEETEPEERDDPPEDKEHPATKRIPVPGRDTNRRLIDLMALASADGNREQKTPAAESERPPALSRIAERVADIIAPIVRYQRSYIDPVSSFRNHYGIDSAQALEIKSSIEEEFRIEITDGDILHIQRVGDLMECVAWKLDADIDVHFQRFGPPTPWHKAWEKEARLFDEVEENLRIRLPRYYIGALWAIKPHIKAGKGGKVRFFLDPQEIMVVNKDGRVRKDWDERVFAFACERENEDNVFVLDIKNRNSAVMRMDKGDADRAEEAAPDLRTWIIKHIPEAKLVLPENKASFGCAAVLALAILILLGSVLTL